jgi:hypothetical protein
MAMPLMSDFIFIPENGKAHFVPAGFSLNDFIL